MKNIIAFFFVLGYFGSLSAYGHGSHSHAPVNEAKAKEIAVVTVKELAQSGKVDESWTSKMPVMSQKQFGKKKEWMAAFEDKAATDPAKKKLYVFLSLSGEFLAVNHTGK